MKEVLKMGFRLVALALALPFAALAHMGKRVGLPNMFLACAQILSLLPGVTGNYVRAAYYRMTLKRCGANVQIYMGAVITKMDTSVGEGCGIGFNTTVGLADVENKAVIGGGCSVLSGGRMHDFSDPSKGPLEAAGVYRRIRIGEKSFVGDRSVVMADIGKQTVVGAGSVVVKDIGDMVVAVGNPARVIRNR